MKGKYTVNEVEERTKVPASTLRQWERRYGFPMPERSESGYRLYSEHDLQQIQAMKRHVEDGVPASRAAELVQQLGVSPQGPRPTQALLSELVNAFVAMDDKWADDVLSEAHALHSVETVMLELLKGVMVEIGQLWHRGQVNTATEHFSSQYVQGRLRTLLNLTPKAANGAVVVVTCAPGDQHELGALMVSVMLRRSGYRVYYLGADMPVADLVDMCSSVSADAVLISASTGDSVKRLREERDHLRAISSPLLLGGGAFDAQPELALKLGGLYLSSDIAKISDQLDRVLEDVQA